MKIVNKMLENVDRNRLTDLTEGVAVHWTSDRGRGRAKGRRDNGERRGWEVGRVVDVYSDTRMRRTRAENGKRELGMREQRRAEVVDSKVRAACSLARLATCRLARSRISDL